MVAITVPEGANDNDRISLGGGDESKKVHSDKNRIYRYAHYRLFKRASMQLRQFPADPISYRWVVNGKVAFCNPWNIEEHR